MNKKVLYLVLVAALVVCVGVIGTGSTYAQESDSLPPMLQRLAERFGLNIDEVKQFLEEEREVHQEERRVALEEELNEAVANGTITEDQKNALLEKLEEKKDAMEQIRDLPKEERHQAMKGLHDEFITWVEENGIDLSVLGMHEGGWGFRKFKRHW